MINFTKIRFYNIVFIALAVILNIGCNHTIRQKGYVFTQSHLKDIKINISHKSEILQILGTPSLINSFNKDRWYYISSKQQSLGFLKPKIIDQQIAVLEFNQDILTNIDLKNVDQPSIIANFSKEQTKTLGDDPRYILKALGNIGRFNKINNK